MVEILDYSEEIKWNDVRKKFLRFESAPEHYGVDSRSLKHIDFLDDIINKFVPDDAEKKLDYFKNKYWEEACEYPFPLSSIYFLTCCYLGKPFLLKCMRVAAYKYLEVGLVENLMLTNLTKEVNEVCVKYGTLNYCTTLQAVIKENINRLKIVEEFTDTIDLWKFRNFNTV